MQQLCCWICFSFTNSFQETGMQVEFGNGYLVLAFAWLLRMPNLPSSVCMMKMNTNLSKLKIFIKH